MVNVASESFRGSMQWYIFSYFHISFSSQLWGLLIFISSCRTQVMLPLLCLPQNTQPALAVDQNVLFQRVVSVRFVIFLASICICPR